MKRALVFAMIIGFSLPALSAAQNDRDRRDREERRRDSNDWRDLKQPNQRWILLTKQQVNFRDDRDRLNIGDIGRHDGKFKELQIRVDGAPVEIRKMVVTFEDGEKFDAVSKRHRFDADSRTLLVDLPGGKRRDIRSIDIDYFSVENQRKDGRGTLYVYAR